MRVIITFLYFVIFSSMCYSAPFFAKVEQNETAKFNQVIDSKTQKPIDNARVSLPQKKYSTRTDKQGKFYLDAQIDGATIMNVEKDGYKPFSVTIDDYTLSKPLVLGIEKSSANELILEDNLCHIGDNSFSETSANAFDFRLKSVGPSFSKSFKISSSKSSLEPFLIIGSIIGVDTLMAQKIGQSHARNAYASPPEVYLNGNKVAEIQINGDNQQIRLPKSLIRPNMENNITIKAGRNLFQRAYTDYDDIEFMNLYIDYKPVSLAGY